MDGTNEPLAKRRGSGNMGHLATGYWRSHQVLEADHTEVFCLGGEVSPADSGPVVVPFRSRSDRLRD